MTAPLILFLKAHVNSFVRITPSGKAVTVRDHERNLAAAVKRFNNSNEKARVNRGTKAGETHADRAGEAAEDMRRAIHAMHAAGVPEGSPHAELVKVGMETLGRPGEDLHTIDPERFAEAHDAFLGKTTPLRKAHVKEHMRVTPSGKAVMVREHDTSTPDAVVRKHPGGAAAKGWDSVTKSSAAAPPHDLHPDALGFVGRRHDKPERLALFRRDGRVSNSFAQDEGPDHVRGMLGKSGMRMDEKGHVFKA